MTAIPLADILSVTTGPVLSHDSVDGLYRILNHMTGDSLMTHQLAAAAEAMAPVLFRQLPWLESLAAPDNASTEELLAWRDWAETEYGAEHDVTPEPAAWGVHDPVADLVAMIGPERVIPVVLLGEDGDPL